MHRKLSNELKREEAREALVKEKFNMIETLEREEIFVLMFKELILYE